MANGNIFDQVLSITTPGFDALLDVIQTETSRVERNILYAQQREQQKDALELKKQYDIEIYNETTGKQQEANREMQLDLAAIRLFESRNERAESAAQNLSKNLLDESRALKKDLKEEFTDRWQSLIDIGFTFLPRPKDFVVAKEESGKGLQGYYVLDSGEYITPLQYEQEYGRAQRGEKIVQAYNKIKEQLRETTREEGVKEGSVLETVFGSTMDISTIMDKEEVAKDAIVKKYLGREDVIEKLAQIYRGNENVIRQFELGLLQFNTQSKFDAEVTPNLRQDIFEVAEFLNIKTDPVSKFSFGGFGAVVLTGKYPESKDISKVLTVKELTEFINENADEQTILHWNRLLDEYPKLDNAVRNVPSSQLYRNPFFTDDTPLSRYFVTEEQLKKLQRESQPEQGSDIEVSNEWLRKRKAQGILQDALNFDPNN